MFKWLPPSLNRELACIASNKVNLELISLVSSFFNSKSVYYPIFRMPSAKYIKNNMLTPNDDDYFENIILQKISRLILNSIAKAGYKIIIIVGLDKKQLSYLELEKYYKIKKIYINDINEAIEKLSFLTNEHREIFKCRKEDIANGLFIAKKERMLLKVDAEANPLETLIEFPGNGIIINELNNDLSDIIIANYAFSIGADIKTINAVSEENINEFNLNLIKWKRENSYSGHLYVAEFINKSLGNLNLGNYQYATFFTSGIPYGVCFNEITCCSHVFRSITEDLFIFNNLYYESSNKQFDSSIIFSPEPTDIKDSVIEEANSVENVLNNNNYWVISLRSNQATVKAFDQYVGHFPYDILHIVSHGGETDGYYVVQEFIDRNGVKHKIEYEEVVGFSPANSEMVKVSIKCIFKYLNGFQWKSKELAEKNYPKYVFDDMFKAISNKKESENSKRFIVNYSIEKSCQVQCFDDIHQGQFNSIASHSSPFIFNNTCTSWKEFSIMLIAAGCRAYIGTLWNIKNEVALSSAKLFYGKVFETTILSATSYMLRGISDEKNKDIYLFCGLHFSTVSKPKAKTRNKVFIELLESLNKWYLYISKTKSKEIIINTIDIIKFICFQLELFYMHDGVIKIIANYMAYINYLEKLMKNNDFDNT